MKNLKLSLLMHKYSWSNCRELQHYFENASWCVLETILKLTLLVSILKFIDISIDLEISIYDPFTKWDIYIFFCIQQRLLTMDN